MTRMLAALMLLSMAVGCGYDPAEKMSSQTTLEKWDERNAFGPLLRPVGMASSRGDWKSGQNALDAEALRSALDAFSSSTAPEGYDKTKIESVVSSGQALIDATSGSAKDFETAFRAFKSALDSLSGGALRQ